MALNEMQKLIEAAGAVKEFRDGEALMMPPCPESMDLRLTWAWGSDHGGYAPLRREVQRLVSDALPDLLKQALHVLHARAAHAMAAVREIDMPMPLEPASPGSGLVFDVSRIPPALRPRNATPG